MTPYLLNMSDDPALCGRLMYLLPKGERTCIGSDPDNSVVVDGLGILPKLGLRLWQARAHFRFRRRAPAGQFHSQCHRKAFGSTMVGTCFIRFHPWKWKAVPRYKSAFSFFCQSHIRNLCSIVNVDDFKLTLSRPDFARRHVLINGKTMAKESMVLSHHDRICSTPCSLQHDFEIQK